MRVLDRIGLGIGIAIAFTALPANAAEWTAKAQLLSGSCPDGAFASVVEKPGVLKVAISLRGQISGTAEVKLAADGSGGVEMHGAAGRIVLSVPAGTGRRPLKTRLVDGSCEWAWN